MPKPGKPNPRVVGPRVPRVIFRALQTGSRDLTQQVPLPGCVGIEVAVGDSGILLDECREGIRLTAAPMTRLTFMIDHRDGSIIIVPEKKP